MLQRRPCLQRSGVGHSFSVSQEAWDRAERLSHEVKHPFQDRWGITIRRNQEISMVEQVLWNYFSLKELDLED